jgi:nucleotide-binding universal stress UspA family protein
MTIVCATRFSEESQHAVNAAAALARRRKEPLHLVHVVTGGLLQSMRLQMTDTATTALNDEVARLKTPGLQVSSALLHGRLEEALASFCAKVDAKLLVVGDTARRTTALLTGTLDRLAYAIEAPLLVVRDERAFVQWSDTRPLSVLVAFDKTASSAVARDWVGRLSEFGPISLTATQVYWPTEEYEVRELRVPPPDEGHTAIKKVVLGELEREFSRLPPAVKVHCRAEMGLGHIGEQLLAVAGEEQVDVVLLGTHRRRALGRFWSVSHHVLLQAPMAVACVPATVAVPDLASEPVWRSALVVSDLTEAGARAVSCGVSMLELGGTLNIAHVSNEPLGGEREAMIAKRLVAELPPGLEARGIRVVAHVVEGDVDEVLVRLVERTGADVIVLPSVLGEGQEMLTTHVAQELLERTRKPVLLSPPKRA